MHDFLNKLKQQKNNYDNLKLNRIKRERWSPLRNYLEEEKGD